MALFPDCTCGHGYFRHVIFGDHKCLEAGCPCQNYTARPPAAQPTGWHPTITKAEVQQLHDTLAAISTQIAGDPVHAQQKLDAIAGQLQTLLDNWT